MSESYTPTPGERKASDGFADGLFQDEEESLSPREAWARTHDVKTTEVEDDHGPKWIATYGIDVGTSRESREDAIGDLAARLHRTGQVNHWSADR